MKWFREKEVYTKYINKSWLPQQTAFMNSIQHTFIEHQLFVELCEWDKDESLLFRSPHNTVGDTHARTHAESSNGLDKIWENISESLEDRSWRDFSRTIPCTCFCSIILSVMYNFVKNHKQALCLVHSVGQEEGKSALSL